MFAEAPSSVAHVHRQPLCHVQRRTRAGPGSRGAMARLVLALCTGCLSLAAAAQRSSMSALLNVAQANAAAEVAAPASHESCPFPYPRQSLQVGRLLALCTACWRAPLLKPCCGPAGDQGRRAAIPLWRLSLALQQLSEGRHSRVLPGGAGCSSTRHASQASAAHTATARLQFLRPTPDEYRPFQHTAHLCSTEQHQAIIAYLFQRNFTEYLDFTPCDMWPFLRGRTLWILGDSQARSKPGPGP